MKKQILLVALSIMGLMTFGQNIETHGVLITAKKVTQDTAIVLSIPTNQAWGIIARWTGGTFSGTTATIKCTKDYGVTYQTYAGITAQTLSGATGSVAFEDPAGCICTAIELYIDINSSEVGYLTVEYELKRIY